MRGQRSVRWGAWGGLGLLMAASALAKRPVELMVVSRLPVPELRSIPRDIRWAGPKTVYVAWSTERGRRSWGSTATLAMASCPPFVSCS